MQLKIQVLKLFVSVSHMVDIHLSNIHLSVKCFQKVQGKKNKK